MPRKWLTALAGLALLLGAAPVTASGAPRANAGGPYRVRMIYRTGGSLASFPITLRGSAQDERGMWFAVELHRRNARWTQRSGNGFGGYQEFGTSAQPQVYGRPEAAAVPRCPSGPACTTPVPLGHTATWHVTPSSTSRYYVVSAHADVQIDVGAKGWRVKDVPNPGFRRVLTGATDATGVRSTTTTAEHFTGATGAGGRWGSSAFGYVPCERGGTGRAVLTGRGATTDADGIPPRPLECGATSCYCYEYAYTPHRTTWRLAGDVTGVGSATARLVVFDFPRP